MIGGDDHVVSVGVGVVRGKGRQEVEPKLVAVVYFWFV